MLTKEMLEGWRKARSQLVPTLDLTPKNRANSQLRAELDAMREQRIRHAERAMQQRADNLLQSTKCSFGRGLAKAHFNQRH